MIGVAMAVAGFQLLSSIHARREFAQQIPKCESAKPDDCAAKGLQANVRAANAAEDLADLTVFQIELGGLGLIGVGLTVHFARNAFAAAQRSASAAERSLKATRQGERRELRAYVYLGKGRYVRDQVEASVDFKNFGLTPAHDVWPETKASVHDYPLTEDLESLDRKGEGTFDLPPNSEPYTLRFPYAEWHDPQHRWGDSDTALYLYGTIHYRDAFGRGRETRFCYYVRSPSDPEILIAPSGNTST